MSKQLNLITFKNENVDNKYIQFEQQMAPRIQYENVSEADKAAFKERHDEIIEIVKQAVAEYLHDERLCYYDEDFPNWNDLTGNYYIGDESYWVEEDQSIKVSIFTRFTQIFKGEEMDYLGLEVWLEASGLSAPFEISGIDSSVI